jgi:hypothetical protein
VEFLLGERTQVLINKYRVDDAYPSRFQSEPGKITIEARVVDGTPTSGIPVYFRLVDPEDTAAYAIPNQALNKGGPGSLSNWSPTTDANGIARTVLTVTDLYSGDNYRVEASLTNSPFKPIAETKIITAWKRGYIEYDRMYKTGQFLNQTSGAGEPFPDRIYVANPSAFSDGDNVHVIAGFPIGNDTRDTAVGEFRKVAINGIGPNYIIVDAPLENSYPYDDLLPPGENYPFSYVADVEGGAFDVTPGSLILSNAFDDAFAEFLFVDVGYVPHWPLTYFVTFGRPTEFFSNRDESFSPLESHVQLIAADSFSEYPAIKILAETNKEENRSQVFVGTIDDECTSLNCNEGQEANYLDSVTVHEFVHHWLGVNMSLPLEHCEEMAWNDSSMMCLMNAGRDRRHGVQKLHTNLGSAPDIDLYCIRGGQIDTIVPCSWPQP